MLSRPEKTILCRRWKCIRTGTVYAVRKFHPSAACAFENEMTGLQRAGSHRVVGVVGLHESMEGVNGNKYVLTE